MIYYTRVDGQKCHRRLTAAGAAEVNKDRSQSLFRLHIPAG